MNKTTNDTEYRSTTKNKSKNSGDPFIGVFLFFMVFLVLFIFTVAPSEDEYKRKVASGEIAQDTETEYDPVADLQRMIDDFKR